ncbi:hypothetical protein cypCar_00028849 [Cyprinus carpio]|nr:hypothetical protein cypCar_00028849 [Cyprinus carpio]
MVENHFSRVTSDHATLTDVVQILQYIIYGIACFFFLYGIILLAEGFYTTSAVKEMHSEFKTTVCGRCISAMFVFLTYILGLGWLGIFGFSAVPVFLFYNMWTACGAMKSPMGQLWPNEHHNFRSRVTILDKCHDFHFIANLTSVDNNLVLMCGSIGIIPWNAIPGKACGSTLSLICNTSEFYLSYHLYIVACAGAGATVIALIHYLMILAANWAYLKGLCQQTHAYQDIKTRDDQELQDVQSRSKEGLNSYS